MMDLPKQIRDLAGGQPHPRYGDWHSFLTGHCEFRDQCKGVLHYGASNCNYIVFPDGLLVRNRVPWSSPDGHDTPGRSPAGQKALMPYPT